MVDDWSMCTRHAVKLKRVNISYMKKSYAKISRSTVPAKWLPCLPGCILLYFSDGLGTRKDVSKALRYFQLASHGGERAKQHRSVFV